MKKFDEVSVTDFIRLIRSYVLKGVTQAEACAAIVKSGEFQFSRPKLTRSGEPEPQFEHEVSCVKKRIIAQHREGKNLYNESIKSGDTKTAQECLRNIAFITFTTPEGSNTRARRSDSVHLDSSTSSEQTHQNCPYCGVPVKNKLLQLHVQKRHPAQKRSTGGLPATPAETAAEPRDGRANNNSRSGMMDWDFD